MVFILKGELYWHSFATTVVLASGHCIDSTFGSCMALHMRVCLVATIIVFWENKSSYCVLVVVLFILLALVAHSN
jgi:hypothetical protein